MGGKFLLGRPVPGPYARSFCDTNADVQSVANLVVLAVYVFVIDGMERTS